jgi:hypothetical protein
MTIAITITEKTFRQTFQIPIGTMVDFTFSDKKNKDLSDWAT